MKEYERIKKMREEEKKQKEQVENDKLKEKTREQILMGNPLINNAYSLKKKYRIVFITFKMVRRYGFQKSV